MRQGTCAEQAVELTWRCVNSRLSLLDHLRIFALKGAKYLIGGDALTALDPLAKEPAELVELVFALFFPLFVGHQFLPAQNAPGNRPPSIRRFCPVMEPACAEHRNAQAAPNWSASP